MIPTEAWDAAVAPDVVFPSVRLRLAGVVFGRALYEIADDPAPDTEAGAILHAPASGAASLVEARPPDPRDVEQARSASAEPGSGGPTPGGQYQLDALTGPHRRRAELLGVLLDLAMPQPSRLHSLLHGACRAGRVERVADLELDQLERVVRQARELPGATR